MCFPHMPPFCLWFLFLGCSLLYCMLHVSPALNAVSKLPSKERTSPVSQGLLMECSLTDLITVPSSVYFFMNPITTSVDPWRSTQSLVIAASLKMHHCVHSKQPCKDRTASWGHTLISFITGGSCLTVGLCTVFSRRVRWSELPMWCKGSTACVWIYMIIPSFCTCNILKNAQMG